MDISQQKYKKILTQYRPLYNNIINQYPINNNLNQIAPYRNLKYLVKKELISSNYPYYNSIYQDVIQEIKISLADGNLESRAMEFRLARALPFIYRIKLIQNCQNEIANAVMSSYRKENVTHINPYGYEAAADLSAFLLSVFELTTQNQQFYFDVNQRIITIFGRFFESCLYGDKNSFKNGCEVIRTIFWTFGYNINERNESVENKLISKLISIFIPHTSFINRQETSMLNSHLISYYNGRSKNNIKLQNMIMRVREFEVRLRGRLLYGFCCLLSYLPQMDYEILNILIRQIFIILQNISQCDTTLQCFSCLSALISQSQLYHSQNEIFKKWCKIIYELSYKKQYLQYYIFLLELTNKRQFNLPNYQIYNLSIHGLELTKNIQQQYTRFIIYIKACRNIIVISRRSYKINPQCNFLLNIFQYGWFIDRINQENDLFKSQFLIALLHSNSIEKQMASQQQIKDLIDICHRLIDWKCTSKQQTHVPTLKFAFDMYLYFLHFACQELNNTIEDKIIQLINRCNQPSIYFLFKFKLIATLLDLSWYQKNHKFLHSTKLNFQFIQNQIRVVMMPKNPKPIFLYDYSLTYDGQIESRKQIEYIKIIMNLLNQISKIHENYTQDIQNITVDYHKYLNNLQQREDSNKQLINCLQTLEADYYFNQCQKYFLLATMDNGLNIKNINFQTNLEDLVLYSHYQTIEFQEEVNIFGPMAPVQLIIKLRPHPSYSSVYIHVKKNQWVQTANQLKLIVSSGLQKKEIPFQSSILQMKIDRIGSLHFQVWKGSGNYKICRKLKWKRYNHLCIIDGIKTKAYFKEVDKNIKRQTYLSYYYGQPIMIHILKQQNQVIFGVSHKDICNQLRQFFTVFLHQLTNGSAQII